MLSLLVAVYAFSMLILMLNLLHQRQASKRAARQLARERGGVLVEPRPAVQSSGAGR